MSRRHTKGNRSIIRLTLKLGAIWWQAINYTPRPLYLPARPGTRCREGLVSPRAGMDGCGEKKFFCPPPGFKPKIAGNFVKEINIFHAGDRTTIRRM